MGNWTKGEEFVEFTTLSENSRMLRAHSKCCYSPLFMVPGLPVYPMIIANRTRFEDDEVFGPVFWIFYADRMWPDGNYPRTGDTVYTKEIPGKFLIILLAKVFYGIFTGQGNTSFMTQFNKVNRNELKPLNKS